MAKEIRRSARLGFLMVLGALTLMLGFAAACTMAELALQPAPTLAPGTPGAVRIVQECSQFDSPGNDNENAREEYVCFENTTDQPIDMTSWRMVDSDDMRYTLPQYSLPAKGLVRIHTGTGTAGPEDLYWGLDRAVWNNESDAVYLYDSYGTVIASLSY